MVNSNLEDYGFILTRHVRDELTNQYWNRAIKCIRLFYPEKKIVVIDDNSDKKYVKPTVKLFNVVFIKSEFPGAGELLPYYYLLKHKFFNYALIIHDSVFIHKKINIPVICSRYKAISLWHFDGDNLLNDRKYALVATLRNNDALIRRMRHKNDLVIPNSTDNWLGSFGGQTLISLNFLIKLEKKYKLSNLVKHISNRVDRMCFERIIGLLISSETNYNKKSLFGNIHFYQKFGYDYQKYIHDFKKGQLPRNVVKVWTGR
jgi:hypothetical protein